MKTINPELSKRLAPYLEDVETDHVLMENVFWDYVLWDEISMWTFNPKWDKYKTLTLEEAIDFMPRDILNWELMFSKYSCRYENALLDWNPWLLMFNWKTLLQAIEKMLEYLLDQWLLWKE